MGFKPKRTLYRLTFEDPDLEGLEVVTRRVSVEGLIGFIDFYEAVKGTDPEKFTPEDARALTALFERFVKVVASWNIEDDDDQPVPVSVEGLQSLELEFVMALIESWITGMAQAPPPLPGNSASGGTSPEAQLAAVSQSRNPGS